MKLPGPDQSVRKIHWMRPLHVGEDVVVSLAFALMVLLPVTALRLPLLAPVPVQATTGFAAPLVPASSTRNPAAVMSSANEVIGRGLAVLLLPAVSVAVATTL